MMTLRHLKTEVFLLFPRRDGSSMTGGEKKGNKTKNIPVLRLEASLTLKPFL